MVKYRAAIDEDLIMDVLIAEMAMNYAVAMDEEIYNRLIE